MTVLGQHSVEETRQNIAVIDFRIAELLKRLDVIRSAKPTFTDTTLVKELSDFINVWTDTRDKEAALMTLKVINSPAIPARLIPAESSFQAIQNVTQVRVPHFAELELRVDAESKLVGLPPLDFKNQPAQDSEDADFSALKKLDKAIKDSENAVKKTASDNKGVLLAVGVAGVLALVILGKIYLAPFMPRR